jgi:hypothetical protein
MAAEESTIASRPTFGWEHVVAVAARYGEFTLDGVLPSERDQNFKLRGVDGSHVVLKIHNPEDGEEFVECQNRALERVFGAGVYCQKLQPRAGAIVERCGRRSACAWGEPLRHSRTFSMSPLTGSSCGTCGDARMSSVPTAATFPQIAGLCWIDSWRDIGATFCRSCLDFGFPSSTTTPTITIWSLGPRAASAC